MQNPRATGNSHIGNGFYCHNLFIMICTYRKQILWPHWQHVYTSNHWHDDKNWMCNLPVRDEIMGNWVIVSNLRRFLRNELRDLFAY